MSQQHPVAGHTATVRQSANALTPNQSAILIVAGVSLWLFAAILLRVLAPFGIYEGWGQLLLYAFVIPGTAPFVWIVAKIARLEAGQVALGIALVTAAATLMDGIALAWFPGLYGDDIADVAGAGAAILWGAGVGLVLGFLFDRRMA